MTEIKLWSVEYRGKEYRVKKKEGLITLDLSGKGIKDIADLKGLRAQTELQVLKLNNNQIDEIKGLETLKNLIKLDLRTNQISEIKDLETLTNLEELYLENNQIEVIKGLDNLVNLKDLNLYGNNISRVESSKNIDNLHTFFLSENPIYNKIQHMPGGSTAQKLVEYAQMSNEEINIKVRKSLEEKWKRSELVSKRIEKKERRIINCGIIIFMIGFICALSGSIIALIDSSTPTGVTLIVIGVIFISVSIGISTKGKCFYCCT